MLVTGSAYGSSKTHPKEQMLIIIPTFNPIILMSGVIWETHAAGSEIKPPENAP